MKMADPLALAQDIYNEAYKWPDKSVHEQVKKIVPIVEAIQHDAYIAGLRRAAEVAQNTCTDYDGCADPKGKVINAILAECEKEPTA